NAMLLSDVLWFQSKNSTKRVMWMNSCSLTIIYATRPTTTQIYPLSLHDALPIYIAPSGLHPLLIFDHKAILEAEHCYSKAVASRSEEHTSELQSRFDLVCRLLLEKKKISLRGSM